MSELIWQYFPQQRICPDSKPNEDPKGFGWGQNFERSSKTISIILPFKSRHESSYFSLNIHYYWKFETKYIVVLNYIYNFFKIVGRVKNMVRSSWERWVLLSCYYSQAHSDLEWLYFSMSQIYLLNNNLYLIGPSAKKKKKKKKLREHFHSCKWRL